MLNVLMNLVSNPKFLLQFVLGLAVLVTVFTVLAPMLGGDTLQKRMKAVAIERERLRGSARDQFNARAGGNRLRQAPKPFMKRIVDDFNLTKWLATDTSKVLLTRAGYRGPQAEIAFLFFRLVTPPVFMGVTAFYVFCRQAGGCHAPDGCRHRHRRLWPGTEGPGDFPVQPDQQATGIHRARFS